MSDVPRMPEWEGIDYLRVKTEINNLPKSLRDLFIVLLKEIDKLNFKINELEDKSKEYNKLLYECKSFFEK